MSIREIEERVFTLEDAIYALTQTVQSLGRHVDDYVLEGQQFRREMREFKTEMREFKDEMREFKDEMRAFKDEMREFKEYTLATNARVEQELKAARQRDAELSDKMGTLAEDMVAPSIPRILAEVVSCTETPRMAGVWMRKKTADGRSKEYDVVAVCADFILVNETKSRLRPADISEFADHLTQEAHDFWPEYAGKTIIGSLAALYVDPSLITFGEKHGLIVLGVQDGLMTILNQSGFIPKRY
ncbi:MAG: hypothetical protein KA314_07940 [Chloroflexi bacterium]|nr:hypothetical protein [Chloroflexota bacterium]MBP8055760.1 hypothetical protein [Chloroflexota bacterium]